VRGGDYYRKKRAEGNSPKEALPQAARLRRRFQVSHGRSRTLFAQRGLTKWSLEGGGLRGSHWASSGGIMQEVR
jgi:hypothetical protein